MSSIERFTLNKSNSFQKQYYDSINNFYIDLDDVMFTEDVLNHQTYTFKINRISNNGLLENLILKATNSDDYDAILVQYNQNILNLNSTIPQEIQNSIDQNVTFTYLGKKSLSEINNKFSYNESCFESSYVYVSTSGNACASGNHSFADGNQCNYWGTTSMATPGTSGYVFTMVGVPCSGGGGSSGELGGSFSTGPHGGAGGGAAGKTPCQKLNDAFDVLKGNIRPSIIALQGTLDQDGENATAFQKNINGTYMPPLPAISTSLNSITAPHGPFVYAEAHTHPYQGPNATFPMFSWTDVNHLLEITNYSASPEEAINMLVTKDDDGINQTYAIVFDNSEHGLITPLSVEEKLDSPEFVGLTIKKKLEILNRELGEKFNNDNNYERDFLRQFFGFNVSLYKANSSLTSWSKLKINSLTGNVTTTPCN